MHQSPTLAAALPLLTGGTIDPPELPETLPDLVLRRWSETLHANNLIAWRRMAELCGQSAISFFAENAYDPEQPDFKAMCNLARVAHKRHLEFLIAAHREREARA